MSERGLPASAAASPAAAAGVRATKPLARRDFLKAALATACALGAGEAAARGPAK